MIGDIIGSVLAIAINGYESLVQMFGSPVVLLAISIALVVAAAVELYVRKHAKPATEVR